MKLFLAKVGHKLSYKFAYATRRHAIHRYLYRATWRSLLPPPPAQAGTDNFMTELPHPTAGIGHQAANWVAGFWFARRFGCRYAYAPFPDQAWDSLLNFGEGEHSVQEVMADGYRVVRLPLFDEDDPTEMAQIERCVAAYAGKRVMFQLEHDQFHRAQFGVAADLRGKFAAGAARGAMPLAFDPLAINIAVHVRRGDVSRAAAEANPAMMMRWQEVDYFERILDAVVGILDAAPDVSIYLFSQGKAEEFRSFAQHSRLHLCLEMDAIQSFSHLAAADVLIASKSGFSYLAALLGTGVRVMPAPFWHDYPADALWVTATGDAAFDRTAMAEALSFLRRCKQTERKSIDPSGQKQSG